MIVKEINITTESRGVIEEKLFNLSVEGLPFVFNILRNSLYSNKELAVLREYSSNGFDAHTEAGKSQTPIKITLPNELEPSLKFRDYGSAMTHEEIRNIFTEYGCSTKRGSNSLIGAYGVGAKSFWAYTDIFNVTSYQKGVKRNYSCYLDETQIGALAYLGEEPTDEPDGLEVSGSVRPKDFNKFICEAQTLFEYSPVRPNIEGADLKFENPKPLFGELNGDWAILPKKEAYAHRSPLAIVAGVPYPINSHSLDWDGKDNSLRHLLSVGIMMRFPIGELEVSASRESLAYSTQTQKAIFSRLAEAKEELIKLVNAQVSGAKSMYDARILYAKIFDYSSDLFIIKDLFNQAVTFNSKPVNSNHWQISTKDDGVSSCRWEKSGSVKVTRAQSKDSNLIFCSEHSPIVINDINLSIGLLNRVAPLLEGNKNVLGFQASIVQVVDVKDVTKYEAWVKKDCFDAPLIKMSALPVVKLKDIYPYSASSRNSNPKHSAKVFRLVSGESAAAVNRNSSSFRRGCTRYWDTIKIDLDTFEGVYVVINSFEYEDQNRRFVSPSKLFSLRGSVKKAGIVFPDEIIGIKVSEFQNRPPKKMVSLWDYITAQLKEKIALGRFEQRMSDHEAYKKFIDVDGNNRINDTIIKHAIILDFDCNGVLGKFLTHVKEMDANNNTEAGELIYLCSMFGISYSFNNKPSYDINKEAEEVKKMYPMILIVDNYNFSSYPTEISNYIKLIETQNKNNAQNSN